MVVLGANLSTQITAQCDHVDGQEDLAHVLVSERILNEVHDGIRKDKRLPHRDAPTFRAPRNHFAHCLENIVVQPLTRHERVHVLEVHLEGEPVRKRVRSVVADVRRAHHRRDFFAPLGQVSVNGLLRFCRERLDKIVNVDSCNKGMLVGIAKFHQVFPIGWGTG